MTARIEKTVFISYRRTNLPWAIAIYQHLASQGFDVFFDYNSIKSGDFEQIITQNVRGRAHFVVILTPSALERCDEPGDWLRREIELAIDEKRNIVPIFFEGFSFGSPSVSQYLTGKLELLKKYNGMSVPAEYFSAAMDRLCNDFLNVPLTAVLHPISNTVEKAVKVQQTAASQADKIEQKELTAQEWFEQGLKRHNDKDYDEAIRYYTEAIRLKPDYADAYNNLGNARQAKGDFEAAIKDFNEAIRLKPDFAIAYNNRGAARKAKGDLEAAIKDYNEAIRLKPDDAMPHARRGNIWWEKKNYQMVIEDYGRYLELGGTAELAKQRIIEAKKKIKN